MSSYGTLAQLRAAQAAYDNMAPEDDEGDDIFPEVDEPRICDQVSVWMFDMPWFVTHWQGKIQSINVNGSWFDAKYTLGTELIRDLEWALKDKLAKEAKEAGK